ncbi:hypothetical protein HBE96_16305 [Clostridium sp. P21]|uniref:Uncharacterized protein n=1 Tax=Clostridium muellerianum TaxID=2716538 RepID=A0A7Y0EIN6_9CLOT|nr:hypothetical protein [Clostridium muellerianum]NMM64189.1 hypothetical protein [Clostridium muellerianum]
MFKKVIISILYAFLISVFFILAIGPILDFIFHYSREAITSYFYIGDSLLVATIFTIILCTLIIIEKCGKSD